MVIVINWTENLIKENIMSVVKILNISHMPTRSEIRGVTGNDALTNKISKTDGYYGWAEKLNLPIKNNDTLTGKLGEKMAAELLKSRGYEVLQMSQNYPFDLLVNQSVKIDVKYANLYHGDKGSFYSYGLAKKYPTCDIYLLISSDDENKQAIFVIPSRDVMQLQISIGEHSSIYHKYLDRYDVIDQYLKLYAEIA